MANGDTKNGNIIFGVSFDKWVTLIQSVGAPMLILSGIFMMAYSYMPDMVKGYVQSATTLERTSETLLKMQTTMDAMQTESKRNGEAVRQALQDHQEQCDKLDAIQKRLDKPTVLDGR